MAHSLTRRVYKIDDRALLQACLDISRVFSARDVKISFNLIPGVPLSPDEIEDPSALTGRYAFETASVHANLGNNTTFALNFRRTIKENNTLAPSAKFDEFDLTFSSQHGEWQGKKDEIAKTLSTLDQLGLPQPQGESDADETLRELMVGFAASHRQMLGSLNEAILANEKKRTETEAYFLEKEEERVAAHRHALDELEAERNKLQLQSYKAERRRILQQMTDDNAASLRKALAPKGAIRTRWAVFLAAMLLSTLAAGLAYESIVQLGSDREAVEKIVALIPQASDANAIREAIALALGPTDWFLIGRSIISSLVAIGGLIYAASWLRNFYNSEVEIAREIDRFNYDLVRASWIIETILEVKHEHGGEIPQEWIQGVTRGLFDSSSNNETLDDGAKALKALMGFTASASFGPDGPKFDIGKREAKKLSKTSSGQASE